MVLLDANNIRGRQTDLDKKVSNYIKSLSIVIDDSQPVARTGGKLLVEVAEPKRKSSDSVVC